MSRSADYTIQGFLYQFNKTLLEILNASDGEQITVEGIVEDIEVKSPAMLTAIQCKYHESSDTFALGGIYKPLLQMMKHYFQNPNAEVRYVLFVHYPSITPKNTPSIGITELQTALATKAKAFQEYVLLLKDKIDLDNFLPKFSIEFGPSFDELVSQVNDALKANGIPEGDVETLAYPNAINMIAGLSVKHDPTERITTRLQFINELKIIRKTAISRWTMALRTRKQLLEARRKQLKHNLDKNCRLRYFIINSQSLEDYGAEIILFIDDFLSKYHHKQAHDCTPLFCLNTTVDDFQQIQIRLSKKTIITNDGYIGGQFDEERFFRNPLICKGLHGKVQREFNLCLLRWEDNSAVLNRKKSDDLFIIGEQEYTAVDTTDVNVEYIAATTLKEVKYVLGVSNVYE